MIAVNADNYQWFKINAGGADTEVPGATSGTLVFESVALADEGFYYCSVTNETAVSVTSEVGRILTRRKMAHWTFDGDLDDEVDSANDGTSPGTITFGEGVDGDAVRIAGPDQFVLIENEIGVLNEVSVSLWINAPAQLPNLALLVVPQEIGREGSVQIISEVDRFQGEVLGSGADAFISGLTGNAWHHLLFVYSPIEGQARYYLNGELADTVTSIDDDVLPNVTSLGIGGRLSDIVNTFEQGLIDDVRIYNFAVTSLNAASIYTEFGDKSVCLDNTTPQFDLNGDCIFNMEDLAVMAATWLECYLVPNCIAPEMP